jgi:hypothetical protein
LGNIYGDSHVPRVESFDDLAVTTSQLANDALNASGVNPSYRSFTIEGVFGSSRSSEQISW